MTHEPQPEIKLPIKGRDDPDVVGLLAERCVVAAYHFKHDTIYLTRRMLNPYYAPEGFLGVLNHEVMHRVLYLAEGLEVTQLYDWLPIWFDDDVQRGSF